MKYLIRLMDDADAQAIARWHYEEPYTFYDADQDPDDLADLLSAEARGESYWAAADEQGELQGFFSYKVEGATVEIGLGMRPDMTGRGKGLEFTQCGLRFARERYRPTAIFLYVAAFNQRAIRLYERVGFVRVERLMRATNGGQYEFVKMVMAVEGRDDLAALRSRCPAGEADRLRAMAIARKPSRTRPGAGPFSSPVRELVRHDYTKTGGVRGARPASGVPERPAAGRPVRGDAARLPRGPEPLDRLSGGGRFGRPGGPRVPGW